MSRQLISRSPDLQRLEDEGYDLEIRSGYLLVKDVPYVNSRQEVKRGILVSTLTTAGNQTVPPDTHVAMWIGEHPCAKTGAVLQQISHGGRQQLTADVTVDCSFSSKPTPSGRYSDYYDKVTAYIAIFLSHAQAIDPNVTAQTYPVVRVTEEESVFEYLDTASSRAQITVASKKLELCKVAIIGVGGTGSYVLDLVAKTPPKEIHLFDDDVMLSHNAFRAPGAASSDELQTKPKKVFYYKAIYSKMRRGIIAHPYTINAETAGELQGMDFVFLCIDGGEGKRLIVEALERFGVSFIDVGMGIDLVDSSLGGILRVTTSTADKREHFRKRVSLADPGVEDEYDRNIQVADLNCLNAALAVTKWKKLCGFYLDHEKEYHSTYTIDCNMFTSNDHKDEANNAGA
jgi:molybdopterin/thiamine biosynthesis adenylyltransferase